MSNVQPSLDEQVKQGTSEKIAAYFASPEFKNTVAVEYQRQLADVIRRSELTARWIAGLAGALILAVFSALLLLQYADIRTKQADLYEKYATGNELVVRINSQAQTLSEQVESKLRSVQDLTTRLNQLETRLTAAEATVSRLTARSPE